jgi:membrane-associated phospholipid phosphatase
MRLLTALAVVPGTAAAIRRGWTRPLDRVARAAVGHLRSPERDAVVRVATDLGSLYAVGAVTGLLLMGGRRRRAQDVAVTGVTAWTAAQVAKRALPRERPYEAHGVERLVPVPTGSSWPSGHAAVAVAMARELGAGRGWFVRSLLGVTARLVGLSRVYVGVHHLSDVVAGSGLGTISASVTRGLRRTRRAAR